MYTIDLKTGVVIRNTDNKAIAPCQSSEDPDFVEYVNWVLSGGVPQEVASASALEVPQSITRAQAIGALILAGLDEAVQPAIDAIQDHIQRKLVQNDWNNRLTFERDNPTLIGLATALGMSSEQLDQLFIQAAQL